MKLYEDVYDCKMEHRRHNGKVQTNKVSKVSSNYFNSSPCAVTTCQESIFTQTWAQGSYCLFSQGICCSSLLKATTEIF